MKRFRQLINFSIFTIFVWMKKLIIVNLITFFLFIYLIFNHEEKLQNNVAVVVGFKSIGGVPTVGGGLSKGP